MCARLYPCLVAALAAMARAAIALPSSDGTVVAALAGHDPTAWAADTLCATSDRALIECNLDVYSLAISRAAAVGAQMVVLPEGYGTLGSPTKSSFFEPMAALLGGRLCGNATAAAASPQQHHVSCSAQNHSIAVAANFFVALPNGIEGRWAWRDFCVQAPIGYKKWCTTATV